MIAICVGHSRQGDCGALSIDGHTTEYEYNCDLAQRISDKIRKPIRIYDSYSGNGYTSAMRWLARKLKEDGAELAVELHFNSASSKATGHEWLHWHSSEKGRLLARALRDSMEDAFPLFTSRGIKARAKGSRGAAFLRLTSMPAVIAEPFFGSRDDPDWDIAVNHKDGVASAIASGVMLYTELASRW